MSDKPEMNIAETSYSHGLIAGGQNTKLIEGVPAFLVPNDHEMITFEYLLDRPKRLAQSVNFWTVAGLIEYAKRFALATETALFSEFPDKPVYIACFDYHESPTKPSRSLHKGTLNIPHSLEWKEWRASDRLKRSQVDFAEFIENNLIDIVDPPGAQMLEIALNLRAKTNITFNSARRVRNGSVELDYHEDVKGTAGPAGKLEIPEKFMIGLAIFEGQEPEKVYCNLRYRVQSGNVLLWYELVRPDRLEREAVKRITKQIKEGLSNILFIDGAPEPSARPSGK